MTERILPHARAIVLCDEVQLNVESGAYDLIGVRTRIRTDAFPYEHAQLCVYLELTSHQGVAPSFITAVKADKEEKLFRSSVHQIRFPGPLDIVPVVFRIRDCRFYEPGLYWIQFFSHEKLVIEHRLTLTVR